MIEGTYTGILWTVVEDGRVNFNQPFADFKAELEGEVEWEAMERGLEGPEIDAAVEFALSHVVWDEDWDKDDGEDEDEGDEGDEGEGEGDE